MKVGPDGSIERHKARLVAQGYSQKYGLDYDETFSAVVRTESARTVIALEAKNNLLLHQMEATTALRGLKITWICIAILFMSCSIILSFKLKKWYVFVISKTLFTFGSTFRQTDDIRKQTSISFRGTV